MARSSNLSLLEPVQVLRHDMRSPLYNQIFLLLKNKIVEGEYAEGALLPSEQEVSTLFKVSRITAKRALNEIARSGLAIRERGRGTRVAYIAGRKRTINASVQSLIDSLRQRGGRDNSVKVLSLNYIAAPAEIARELGIKPGSLVQHAVRTCLHKGTAHSQISTYIPEEIGRFWSIRDMTRKPLATLFADAGVVIERADQMISATLADSQTASILDVAVGAPLIKMIKIAYTDENVPAEYMVSLHPPERYHFHISLTHDDSDQILDTPGKASKVSKAKK
jgi:GntR family transcriptional regulator